MRLGVVSDTHGHIKNSLAAIDSLDGAEVDVVIHCGDIGSVAIVPLFQKWPTHFVFGNVDRDEIVLRAAIEKAKQTCHGRFGSLELEGKRIAFLHGDDTRRWQATVAGEEWDLVCFGHTHRAETRRAGRTLLLNPGAAYRATPHSVAVVELDRLEIKFLEF